MTVKEAALMDHVASGGRVGLPVRAARAVVDFSVVPPKQGRMHERLENWARWCGGGHGGSSASPMFRLFRSDNWGREVSGHVVDGLDAQRVQKFISALPGPHRLALSWCYLRGVAPLRMARDLAVSLEGLARLVNDARTMLINRGA